MFVAPVTLATMRGLAPGTVVTDDVPRGALAGFAPRQAGHKEGYDGGKRDD